MGQITKPVSIDSYKLLAPFFGLGEVITFDKTVDGDSETISTPRATNAQLAARLIECTNEESTPPSGDVAMDDADVSAFTFFCDVLVNRYDYTVSEVEAGLSRNIVEVLPIWTPTVSPSWAIVRGSAGCLSLAWFDPNDEVWTLAQHPWARPFIEGEWIYGLENSFGSGNSQWTYWMGVEIEITQDCSLRELAAKWNTDTDNNRKFQVLKATTTGGQPTLSNYTQILATGEFDLQSNNVWTQEDISDIQLQAGEWIIIWAYVGAGGQTNNIGHARSTGSFRETVARVNAGIYRFYTGGYNGSTPGTPSNRSTTTIYGLVTGRFGAPS